MRRLLVVVVLLVCEASGLAQLAVRPAQRPEPAPAVAARLAALDPGGARLAASAVAADGTLRRLQGALQLQGATLEQRAADFVARYAPLFGADAAVEFGPARALLPRADGSPRALRLAQLVHGFEVDGAGLLLTLDEQGRATGAHGWVSAAAAGLPLPVVGAAQARDTALARLGVTPDQLRGEPTVRGAVRLGAGGPRLVQRVTLVLRAGMRPLGVDVDAQTGAVLSVWEDSSDAQGNIVFNGVPLGFNLVSGSGNAYTSISSAKKGQESLVTLPSLTLDTIDAADSLIPGTLTGRYCTVSDTVGILFNSFLVFSFSDSDPSLVDPQHSLLVAAEAFDHVNTYSWITRTAKAYTNIMGTLPSDTCLPVFVNEISPPATANAFFSPTDFDGASGFAPGFMVFDELDTGDFMDDFSRDPTIVSHEYFHAVASFAGLQFGVDADHPDTPERAVNEAIADYGSATINKTSLFGPVLALHAGDALGVSGDALRDLDVKLTLQDDLFDTLDPQNGLPEEHAAGNIFGAAEWRLRGTAKAKLANSLLINHLADWPQSSAEVGFDPVTPGNAQAAYEAFDFGCFLAVANAALGTGDSKGWSQVSKVLGAFLAHGICGATQDTIPQFPTDTPPSSGKITLAFNSEFLGTLTDHVFDLQLAAGQQLSITLTGNKDDATQVDFAFLAGPALSFPQDKTVNAAGTKVSQKGILVNTDGVYVLDLFSNSGPGRYKVQIKIK